MPPRSGEMSRRRGESGGGRVGGRRERGESGDVAADVTEQGVRRRAPSRMRLKSTRPRSTPPSPRRHAVRPAERPAFAGRRARERRDRGGAGVERGPRGCGQGGLSPTPRRSWPPRTRPMIAAQSGRAAKAAAAATSAAAARVSERRRETRPTRQRARSSGRPTTRAAKRRRPRASPNSARRGDGRAAAAARAVADRHARLPRRARSRVAHTRRAPRGARRRGAAEGVR